MAEETSDNAKPAKSFDSAYGFSFSITIGLALFIAGLIVTLTVGEGMTGLIFGLPLIFAGLIVPLFMMRDSLRTSEIQQPCPNCGIPIRTSDATLQLRCVNCQQVINVRDGQLLRAEG